MKLDIPKNTDVPSIDIDAYAEMEKVFTSVNEHVEIYKGEIDGYEIAIKIGTESETVRHLEHEAEVLRRMEGSEYAPRLYLDGHSDRNDKQVLAMEFVSGTSLASELGIDATWNITRMPSEQRATQLVGLLAEAERDMTRRGVLYRDYNPSHFIFKSPTEVTLIDFGAALIDMQVNDKGEKTWINNDHDATWEFMAPEEFTYEAELDESIVPYRLGALYHLLLTGRLPVGQFESRSQAKEWAENPTYDLSDSLTDTQRDFIGACLDGFSSSKGIVTVEAFIDGLQELTERSRDDVTSTISRTAIKNT